MLFHLIFLFRLGNGYFCSGNHRTRYPDISANDNIVPDYSLCPKQGCALVDNDIVADSWVAFASFDDVTFLVFGKA